MELFEQQYFTEQYIILTKTEEGHETDLTNLNFSLQNSCTPQVFNDIRTDLVNLYNRNIFKTFMYIYIFQDEKCRLMRNLSLSSGSLVLFAANGLVIKFLKFPLKLVFAKNERGYRGTSKNNHF